MSKQNQNESWLTALLLALLNGKTYNRALKIAERAFKKAGGK